MLARLLFLAFAVVLPGHAQNAGETDSPLTPLTLPGAESFIYHDVAPEPMRLHVFRPEGWQRSDRRPAFIHFFGGGFVRGTPHQSAGLAQQASTVGLIGVAADYRVNSRHGTDGTACLADARAAVRWLQDHANELGLDPQRIVVGGSSAGGLLALWTAITASPPGSDPLEAPRFKPAALILMWPAADLTLLPPAQERFDGRARACSAAQHLDPQMPPILLLHGDADPIVPIVSSVNLHATLTKTGNICEFITMTGCGHGATVPEWGAKLPVILKQFLTDQHILPVVAQP